MENSISIHVVKGPNGGWNVRKKGSMRALRSFGTKPEATKYAMQLSKKLQRDLVIHEATGYVEKRIPATIK